MAQYHFLKLLGYVCVPLCSGVTMEDTFYFFFFTWVVVKQKCLEDNILESVSEEGQGQLETPEWVSAPFPPHGCQDRQQLPSLGALLCS